MKKKLLKIADVVIEEDLKVFLLSLEFNIEEFYVVTTIDKKTLFPINTSAIANITMTMDEDTNLYQTTSGWYVQRL